jgi:hypothetical protein
MRKQKARNKNIYSTGKWCRGVRGFKAKSCDEDLQKEIKKGIRMKTEKIK